MVRLYLVGCGKAKKEGIHKAKDLYTSNYFKLKLRYAEMFGDKCYILSAKHRLLDPEKEIEKYCKKVDDFNKEEKADWVAGIISKLKEETDISGTKFIFLAGKKYYLPIVEKLGREHCELPLEHMGIGKQMGYLRRAIDGKC